jgi:hypothetical protein
MSKRIPFAAGSTARNTGVNCVRPGQRALKHDGDFCREVIAHPRGPAGVRIRSGHPARARLGLTGSSYRTREPRSVSSDVRKACCDPRYHPEGRG